MLVSGGDSRGGIGGNWGELEGQGCLRQRLEAIEERTHIVSLPGITNLRDVVNKS